MLYACAAYGIGGRAYFDIRDIARLLAGTDKKFNVTVSGSSVAITTGSSYSAAGDETTGRVSMTANPCPKTKAMPSAAKLTVDGAEKPLTIYDVEGEACVKHSDIVECFNSSLGSDPVYRATILDTTKPYEG